ncbi:hypothetical protein [Larkinella humicola]|uniref:Uncharacterized protein n=1 Tax=Larkinella humicola TaxID=2607654 RepID=A0A5N1JAP3_9BACT|nr:hypothetical protein [Larkinella humicola]KAA9349747.1 hypothetical protein F0P93_20050 [Larkinella humicola]
MNALWNLSLLEWEKLKKEHPDISPDLISWPDFSDSTPIKLAECIAACVIIHGGGAECRHRPAEKLNYYTGYRKAPKVRPYFDLRIHFKEKEYTVKVMQGNYVDPWRKGITETIIKVSNFEEFWKWFQPLLKQ